MHILMMDMTLMINITFHAHSDDQFDSHILVINMTDTFISLFIHILMVNSTHTFILLFMHILMINTTHTF